MRSRRLGAVTLAAVLAGGTWGCMWTRYATDTPRSATEQLLVSEAAERAVAGLEWPELAGRRVAVEVSGLNEADAPFLRSVAEARARELGSRTVPAEEAELVLLLVTGTLGTVSRNFTFGVPSLPTPFGATPELPFFRILRHRGYAKLRLVGFDSAGAHAPGGEPALGRASFELYSLLFLVLRRNDIYPGETFSIGLD